ncbi:hypothetical protein MYX04_01200 [Nitrospiraceae bacterium AH_259_D15_M11_P09]|nr:hypothetical protein [Nitrospiraceae bacterium AH_259_D15_M11_P09]
MSTTIWISDLTYTQQQISADVMPAAVGGIATFCAANLDPKPQIRVFKYPEKLIAAMQESAPQIAGFSNYVWNCELCYGFAELFKRLYPSVVIVFGGPNYPTDTAEQEQFLREHQAIDFYIVKEGEVSFYNLVKALQAYDFEVEAVNNLGLGGVHSITTDRRFVAAAPVDRLQDLTVVPSPYVTGTLDEFFDGKLMPILQTNRGCPFACTFCIEGSGYYNKIYKSQGEKVAGEIDYIGRKMAEIRILGGRNDLFIADSNFGMYKEDLETCRQLGRTQEKYQWPEYINVATGKNKKERVLEASRLVKGAMRLSGSVQSLDQEILTNIKRANIDAPELMQLALEANEIGANSYSEIILGLPGDSVEKHLKTVETVIDAGFNNVYLFQLMMLPGTELALQETRVKYDMQIKYRALPRCFGHYRLGTESVTNAEIEEICVSLNTLSFDDYVYCRKFHLIVTCFYNDGVFQGLLKLLRDLNISRFAWLKAILDHKFTGELADLFHNFIAETKEELWDSKEDLVAFTRKEENIEKYISGELGANLLFKYKGLAITKHLKALADVARATVEKVISENGRFDGKAVALVNDVLLYEVARKSDLFSGDYQPRYCELRYDVEKFMASPVGIDLSEFSFPVPCLFRFVHDDEQKSIIDRNINLYGRDTLGVSRILSKVYLKRLFRHVENLSGTACQAEYLNSQALHTIE